MVSGPASAGSSFFKAPTEPRAVGISLGASVSTLNNAVGFDVDYGEQGKESETNGASFIGYLDQGIAPGKPYYRRLSGRMERTDFDGLSLLSVTTGVGAAWRPLKLNFLGIGASVGVAAGLTQARSFLSSTIHPTLELNASMYIRLWALTVGLNAVEQATASRTLDERSAAPRTSSVALTFGISF